MRDDDLTQQWTDFSDESPAWRCVEDDVRGEMRLAAYITLAAIGVLAVVVWWSWPR